MEKRNLKVETVEIHERRADYKFHYFKITNWSKNTLNADDIRAATSIKADILIKNQTCINNNSYRLIRRFLFYYSGIVFNTLCIKAYSSEDADLQSIIDNVKEWCYIYVTGVDLFIKDKTTGES